MQEQAVDHRGCGGAQPGLPPPGGPGAEHWEDPQGLQPLCRRGVPQIPDKKLTLWGHEGVKVPGHGAVGPGALGLPRLPAPSPLGLSLPHWTELLSQPCSYPPVGSWCSVQLVTLGGGVWNRGREGGGWLRCYQTESGVLPLPPAPLDPCLNKTLNTI